MALIDDVRTSLRIKTNAYDDDIQIYIDACLYDLSRVNIQTTYTDSTTGRTVYYPEVKNAVIAFVKSQFGNGDEDKKKLLFAAYENLRLAMFLDKSHKVSE